MSVLRKLRACVVFAAVLLCACNEKRVLSVPQDSSVSRIESERTVSSSTEKDDSIRTDGILMDISDESKPIDIPSLIHGIRNISTYEGIRPDTLSGITWNSNIRLTVTEDDSGVDWDTEGEYKLFYHVRAETGEFVDIPCTVKVRKNLEEYLYGSEGRAKVLTEEAEDFTGTEDIEYDTEQITVSVDTSRMLAEPGDYVLIYELKGRDGHTQTMNRIVSVVDSIEEENKNNLYVDGYSYSTMTDLGIWRLTAYMDTPEDQGPYVGQTASGSPLVAGRTVAVSAATCARHGLSFGDKLMVNGHIYTLEDHGGSAMYDQDWIDIFVDNIEDEYSEAYNQYSHVYLLK